MLSPLSAKSFAFIFLILISVCRGNAQAPWTRVTPTPVEQSIKDMVRIPGTERIMAVADGSTLMTTDNQGETWDIILNPANIRNDYRINDIYFIDNQTGFIGGGGQTILKTIDGGESWNIKFGGESIYNWNVISNITFMNDTTGFALGNYNEIFKTTDRGETWFQMDTLRWADRFHRINNLLAYITNFYPGTWMKTTDGGNTWITENHPFGNPNDYITDMSFLNDSTAVAALYNEYEGTCKLYKTTNAGDTWTDVYTTSWDLTVNKLDFFDELHGIALCWSLQYRSSILLTNDGGSTWSETEQPIDWQDMNMTCYYDQNMIFAGGSYGFLYKSTDAGLTWTELSRRELGSEIYKVQFVNDDLAYATCGNLGGGVSSTSMYKSTDGGMTWSYFGNQTYPSAFYFLSDSVGFVVGDAEEVYKFNHGDWEILETGFAFSAYDIKFLDEMNGIVSGEGRVIKTTDGGITWSDITPIPNESLEFNNIELRSPETVFVTDQYDVYKSTDGGWSWLLCSVSGNGWLNDLVMPDDDNIYVAQGDQIYKSTDGGLTWNAGEIEISDSFWPNSLYFPTSIIGYAVGEGMYTTIIKTIDGGITWDTLVSCSTTPLSCVYFSDENNGLVFGDLGLVMKTETGGVVSAGNIPVAENNCNFFVNPNPFNRELRIGFNRQPVFPVEMSISDIAGKTITRQQIKNTSETVISTDALKSGVYILSVVYLDGSMETRKVIKL